MTHGQNPEEHHQGGGRRPAAAWARPDSAAADFERFLAQGRDGPPGLWRVVATIAFVVIGHLAVLTAMALSAEAAGYGLMSQNADGRTLLVIALGTLATTPALLALALRLLHRRRLATLLGPEARVDWRSALIGALLALTLGAIGLSLSASLGFVRLDWSEAPAPSLALLALVFLLIVPQAAGEELLFRGYLLQAIGCRAGSALAWAAAPAAVFALLHYDGAAAPGLAASYVASTFLFGLFAAALVWREGGLSAAIGMHVANNWMALLLLEPAQGVDGLGPIAIEVPPDAIWPALALDAALLIGAYALFSIALRRRM